jgi:hypothetical protein
MNILLLPTDFSPFANDAFDMACQLCLLMNGNLHIYHNAENADEGESKSSSSNKMELTMQYADIEVKQNLMGLNSISRNKGITTTTHYSRGKFLKKLEELIMK